MLKDAVKPYGKALLAFFEGDTTAEVIIRRDDGQETPIPIGLFFRDQSDFTPIDVAAVDNCLGHILDVGAGSGVHSLALQGKGLSVTAIDVNPEAVRIMRKRGVRDVRCTDIFEYLGSRFDTLLMLGHGLGMVETIAGLDRFLVRAHRLVSENGQLLLHSNDVQCTDDPSNLAYQEANQQAGRYIGEIRLQTEFRGEKGPYFGWLQVDAETLKDHAEATGWQCEVLHRLEAGDYLARLINNL